MQEYQSWTVPKIKFVPQELGLSCLGRKAELVARLSEDMQSSSDQVAQGAAAKQLFGSSSISTKICTH